MIRQDRCKGSADETVAASGCGGFAVRRWCGRMVRRASFAFVVAIAGLLLVMAAVFAWHSTRPENRAEKAMRAALRQGWAGTNEAWSVVRQLPTDQALGVLVKLLRQPESRSTALYRRGWEKLSPAMRKKLPAPANSGPVEMCAYHWLADALQRTNVTVDPLLPLLEERPDLFWNIVTAPLMAHLKAHQDDVRKLIPLLRRDDIKIVGIVAHLVAHSDLEGESEPEFRRLLPLVPDDRVGWIANGLLQVSRRPQETANWLWDEVERQSEVRCRAMKSTIWMLEMRGRREEGWLASKLASTNGMVRLVALQVAQHPGKSESAFSQVKSLAISGNAEERDMALQSCVLLALAPKKPLDLRLEAARIVRDSGDAKWLRKLREGVEFSDVPRELQAEFSGAASHSQ